MAYLVAFSSSGVLTTFMFGGVLGHIISFPHLAASMQAAVVIAAATHVTPNLAIFTPPGILKMILISFSGNGSILLCLTMLFLTVKYKQVFHLMFTSHVVTFLGSTNCEPINRSVDLVFRCIDVYFVLLPSLCLTGLNVPLGY